MAEGDILIGIIQTAMMVRSGIPRATLQCVAGRSRLDGGESRRKGMLTLVGRAEGAVPTAAINTTQGSSARRSRSRFTVSRIAVYRLGIGRQCRRPALVARAWCLSLFQ